MSDTNVCKKCASTLQKRDESLSNARRALEFAIKQSSRALEQAVSDEDYSDAASRRAYLNGLRVAQAMLEGVK